MLLSVGYIFIFILLVSGLAHARDKVWRSGAKSSKANIRFLGTTAGIV
jgi:hypothetical protein